MNVNHYTIELMNEEYNSATGGIVFGAEKSDAIVMYTFPEDNNKITIEKYMAYITTEEVFNMELLLKKSNNGNKDENDT